MKELAIAYSGNIFLIPEDELEESGIGYTSEELDRLPEGLPEGFLLNFFWNGSARFISRVEQENIIELIQRGYLDDCAY